MGQLAAHVPGGGSSPRWLFLLRPRWLCFHAAGLLGIAGMLWLGGWQLQRALSGNELSWAYTFEWPLFAIFAVYFWVRAVREELRTAAGAGRAATAETGRAPAAGRAPVAHLAEQTPPAAHEQAGEAYLARLKAEVRDHGRWHGLR